jgi:hypothetical protein
VSKRRPRTVEFPFVPLPQDLGAAWNDPEVSTYARGLALLIVQAARGLELPCVSSNWQSAVCRAIKVKGTERPAALKALEDARKRRLIEHTGTVVRVLTDYNRGPSETPARSEPDPSESPASSGSGPGETPARPEPGQSEVRSRPDSSDGNDSGQPPEKEEKEEKDQREERDTRARVRDPSQLSPAALALWEGYELRYVLEHDLPVTASPENLAAAESVGSWLGKLRGELSANVRRLLDGYFRHPWGKHKRHALPVLASSPENYFDRQSSGEGDDYLYPDSSFGPPTDVNALPPVGAAQ